MATPPRSAAATVALTALVAILATVAVLSILYKKQAGETFIRLGEMILGQRHEQAADTTAAAPNAATDPASPALPTPTPNSSQAPASASNGSNSRSEVPSSQGALPPNAANITPANPTEPAQATAGDSDSPAPDARSHHSAGPTVTARKSSNPARLPQDQSDGRTELALAQDYLSRGTPKSREVAMQLLWVAVGDGNTEAEVELADLYLSGESRNCTQARILLKAAADSGNVTAGQKLEQLANYGCR